MASSRTINAPGVELREIDRSRYGIQDNSLPNAPVVLVTGFADKGENYYPQWINEKQTFFQRFGYPSTEEEKYFFNACMDVIDRGGSCIACRLPYDNNESKDNGQFAFCDYQLLNQQQISESKYKEISALDSTIDSFSEIIVADAKKGTISLEQLDNLRIGLKTQLLNKIRIVDISKSKYGIADFPCVKTISSYTNDALGIFPVIVTPMNAIYFQGLFNNLSSSITDEISAGLYNEIQNLTTIVPPAGVETDGLSALSSNQIIPCAYVGLSSGLSDDAYAQETISKIAADQFPLISFKDPTHLDSSYLKHIGVVVFKAFSDPANNNKVNFQILESFIGSLDKRAKSQVDNSSAFIDNIVNANSRYINLFSNIDSSKLERTKILHMSNQTVKMLGFYQADCQKKIFVKGDSGQDGQNDVVDSISKVLEICKDSNQMPIDIVVDAGVSNIAQFWNDYRNKNDATFPVGTINGDGDVTGLWTMTKDRDKINYSTKKWMQVIKKFDDFCHYTRKDCMFIADGLRPFCLEGNLQKVRKTKPGSSVQKDIVPYINGIAGINSSYSAGYCNWFQVADKYSGDYFWCPPSIKAASIYIYCDTYFHSWDAPAGMTRGIVPGAINVAFNPNKEDAGKIYSQSWNYAVSYPMDGIIMEGQKSFQYDKTALDRVNVRRLLLKLEKQVVRAAKYFLYEQNTEYQRQKFVDIIRPFFEAAVNGSGISEYAIKCDAELNTPEVIDNNEMHCKIALKPIKTIEYIVISLISTSQSASVTEEVRR